MMKSFRENLSHKTESILTDLNECFKIVSATLVPSERGVYITDNKVECRLVVESYFPKDVKSTRAAISIETCSSDKINEKRTAKGYKTDLSVNSNVGTQTNSPRKAVSDVPVDSDQTQLISR